MRLWPVSSLAICLIFSCCTASLAEQDKSQVLRLYDIGDLPDGAIPILIARQAALVLEDSGFSDSLLSAEILANETGDYYVLRVKSAEDLNPLAGILHFFVLDDMAIFRIDPHQATALSRFGWGLTRLRSQGHRCLETTPGVPPSITQADSSILEMISVITPESSRRVLSDISGIYSRYSFVDGCRQAEQYAFDQFSLLGLQTSFFGFQYLGTAMRDVIGQKIGEVFMDSVVIICGHLDSYSESPETDAPGAEDNGSGSVAVLEAARALSRFPTDLTIRFILFTGEEQGLIGSDAYAGWVDSLNQPIKAVINLDMVAYTGSYATDMHVFSDAQSFSLGALAAQVLATYTTVDTIPHYEQYPRYGSDHYSFAIRGYPSIFFIDAWFGYDWYPYYHTTADTLGNLNMDLQSASGRVGAALAATLARLHSSPSILPGDANGSNDVNGLDVVYLVNYLKGGPAPNPLLGGDANGDCSVNGLDVIYLVNYLKGGPAPIRGNCQ
jgi:hypothetical protein